MLVKSTNGENECPRPFQDDLENKKKQDAEKKIARQKVRTENMQQRVQAKGDDEAQPESEQPQQQPTDIPREITPEDFRDLAILGVY